METQSVRNSSQNTPHKDFTTSNQHQSSAAVQLSSPKKQEQDETDVLVAQYTEE